MRENLLDQANQLNEASESLVKLAEEQVRIIASSCAKGVAAQTGNLVHQLHDHAASFERGSGAVLHKHSVMCPRLWP